MHPAEREREREYLVVEKKHKFVSQQKGIYFRAKQLEVGSFPAQYPHFAHEILSE